MQPGVFLHKYVIKDPALSEESRIGSVLQEFSGDGAVFLEVRGDIREQFLHHEDPKNGGEPESVVEVPGKFAFMTEGITMKLIPLENLALRDALEAEYLVRYTASKKDGFVYFGTEPFKENKGG